MYKRLLALWICTCPVFADDAYIVKHLDAVLVDNQLTLDELVDFTLQNYPDGALIPALKQEAQALQKRGDSWVAGALSATFYYRDGWVNGSVGTGAPEIEGAIAVPLWNWGQRAAGQNLALAAKNRADLQADLIRLQVAGLVRNALWDMALVDNNYVITKRIYDVSKQLFAKVKQRVDLGDLPRTDLLLAQSEQLQMQADLVRAEAEQMHARKRFATLTQSNRIPAEYAEQLSSLQEVPQTHPVIRALNAEIERMDAKLNWVKAAGSGQASVALGGNSQRYDAANSAETIVLEVNVPFGGSAHLAPEIAEVNILLKEVSSRRDHALRTLEEAFHEAEHALNIDRAELDIARQRKDIAEQHLKMTRLSFDAGEINFLDLLKIQSLAHTAIRDAYEREIIYQRDIALYNQVVGLLP